MDSPHPPYQAPAEVAPGICVVPIPIPIPLRYVNCYLCEGPSGWTIVDAGFHDSVAEDSWLRAFADLSISPQSVDRILVTHYHPDHIGAAGWLQQLTGAPTYLHAEEFRQVELFWGEGMPDQADELRTFFASAGMPAELAEAIRQRHIDQTESVKPRAALTPIPTGSRFRIGAAEYEVLWTPGHSDGLAIFYQPDTGVLMANDMLLAKITPNVSLWPRCRPNPLQDYLESLARVEALGARIGLTGHRAMIRDVAGRAREIRKHHAERLNAMERVCGSTRGATAWDVCEAIFAPATLTVHQIRFAMSESLAHLVYMEKQGRLLCKGNRFVQA